jgi:hypothetical protein
MTSWGRFPEVAVRVILARGPVPGQIDAPAAHDVQSTYRVSDQFFCVGSGGPKVSETSSLVGNLIIPNSCQVDDSSCPALRKNTKSKPAGTSGPWSATQAALPSVRMSREQSSPAGQFASLWNSMPYSCDLPGIRYRPNAVRSTPYRPPESSNQYSCSV